MKSRHLPLSARSAISRLPTVLAWTIVLVVGLPAVWAEQTRPAAARDPAEAVKLTKYVDPMIATKGEANGFPGPKLPFGVVALSPDCGDLSTNSGYAPDAPIRGFSHLHASGTGGGPKYGVISLLPLAGRPNTKTFEHRARIMPGSETAAAGYYSVRLIEWDGTAGDQKAEAIKAELTVSRRAGFHRYTFPPAKDGSIVLDVSHHLSRAAVYGENQSFEGGRVVIDKSRPQMDAYDVVRGYGEYAGGWNRGRPYAVFFYATFDPPPARCKTWSLKEKNKTWRAGAYASYPRKARQGDEVEVRVGISFVSVEQARKNLQREIGDSSFDAVRQRAESEWDEVLKRVTVSLEGVPQPSRQWYERELEHFYSALYRCHLMPSDRTGEYPEPEKWPSSQPYYDDYYCLWDTYRTLHPLLTITETGRQADMVRSLVGVYQYEGGYMPDGRSGNCNGRTQGGSNADIVVADAFAKRLSGVDYEKAFQAMLKDAQAPPQDSQRHGRGGLEVYNARGFIPVNIERSATRTVEYSICDFAIASVADGLRRKMLSSSSRASDQGDQAGARKYASRAAAYARHFDVYLGRSRNWRNLWCREVEYRDPNDKDHRFRGFVWPRHEDGSWVSEADLDTLSIHRKSQIQGPWNGVFYEDNSWSYSVSIPHDVAGVVNKCGGEEAFRRRLDYFFEKSWEDDRHGKTPDASSAEKKKHLFFRIGNEPDFLLPYLYLWTRKPEKTPEIIRKTLQREFHDPRDGSTRLPGNDDAGAMSSWYIFAVSGFYPIAGTDVYLIGIPLFPKVSFRLENGREFVVETPRPFPLQQRAYISQVTLNGKPLQRPWFRHSSIVKGGSLVFTLSDKPSQWAEGHLPPSGAGLFRATEDESR